LDTPAAGQPPKAPPPNIVLKRVLRFAPVTLVVLIVIALVWSGVLKHLSLHELHERHGQLAAYVKAQPAPSVLIYLAVYVAAVGLSLPAPLVMTLTGGFLFGPWLGGVLAALSCTGGASIAFLIARLTVGDALEHDVGPRVKAFEEGVKKDALFYLITLRLLPIMPFWLVNVAAGLLSIRLSTFCIATLIGIFPVSLIYAGIGSGLGRIFNSGARLDIHALITPSLVLPLAGLALLSFLPILYHWWRGRSSGAVAGAPSVADDAGAR
jgi:uncharacterized membrane protein YdjX (TVP38/TMEM64 family)